MVKTAVHFSLSSRFCLLALCFIVIPPLQASNSELGELLGLVDERLQLMKDVAAYKFANDIEIENSQREALVHRRAMLSARQVGLEPAAVEAFFRVQIQQAKVVQKGWIERWRALNEYPFPDTAVPDLSAEIRPKLIDLGERIVQQLPLALPELHDHNQFENNLRQVERVISSSFISKEMQRQLLQALVSIELQNLVKANSLEQILHRGVLRVGTTGDYKPFSYIDANTAQNVGVDIDLAESLASTLGVNLQLVATSWPTLMTDLATNKFDIGMSGITRTLSRQRSAFFSDQYSVGGKTPIARCDEKDQFSSLSKIDQAHVRVIVNPGGTNEKFIRQTIKNAQILTYADNTTIFEQIANKKADVMITDAIEVKVQEGAQPQLCATMPGQLLTRAEKAFLMPQDNDLKDYVNTWLRGVEQSGFLAEVFDQHMATR